ncbi:transporter substrate-binding domain-containing protein [Streptomyces sp. SID8361]|uniref:transporter substrate-binding domain-containing protein n=1 Tax=Streptomyces sp. MnatMP-M27 TaxID=1839768 RepID=UPI00081EDABE|nr:transporter substrate-binding domain-containing protein [Streptomyces sp. MnatMP-M27]MYU11175.1 transporter substrate-binding domain-containing protein [Streptomyces sp. SID8361]SCF78919.1 ABC-type amino acid transport substrate-binding protein [Streptomyces sp. MnatMP-M27]
MTTASTRRRLVAGVLMACTSLAAACSGGTESGSKSTGTTPSKAIEGVAFDQKIADMLPESIKKSKMIKQITFQNPPYTAIGSNGDIQGLSTDVAAAVSKVFGVKVEQGKAAALADAKVAVQSGRYDVGFGPFLPSAESMKTLTVVQIMTTSKSILYKKTGATVDELTDLCGKTLASAAGSLPSLAAVKSFNTKICPQAGLPDVKSMQVPDQSAQIVAVQSGRAFAAQITDSSSSYFVKTHPGYAYYVLRDGNAKLFPAVPDGNIIDKKNTALSAAWLAALKKLYDSGALEKIYKAQGLAPDLMEPSIATKPLKAL